MSVTVVIPARYASTRLPGKPLLARTGKPLIQHVVEAVRGARRVDRVVVATDDERIAQAVAAFGGQAVMTRPDHATGTDRIAETVAALKLGDDDIVVNVQGDEPEISPTFVDALAELVQVSRCPMATLAAPLPADQAGDTNKVKVVLAKDGKALYFSRAKIPFDRDDEGSAAYLLHLGLYAYRAAFLRTFAALPRTPAEKSEKLEQLRALESGYAIAVGVVNYDGCGIDTPEDYERFVRKQQAGHGS